MPNDLLRRCRFGGRPGCRFWLKAAVTAAAFLLTIAPHFAHAEAAQFWLSLDGASSAGPESPSVVGAMNTPRRVHIWGRPGTVGNGDYHPTTNPYQRLKNISLRVVTPQSGLLLDLASMEVHNPIGSNQQPRFQHINDLQTGFVVTTNPDELLDGMAMGALGIMGFTVTPNSASGFGGVCAAGDADCSPTPDGGDAWRFASFDIDASSVAGDYQLFLQVGINAMSHVGESASDMRVRFGVDTTGQSPALYNPALDKRVTLADDDPDLLLSLRRPGDYNGDGDVNHSDYQLWSSAYGTAYQSADGNGDGLVDGADYTLWRDNLTPPAPALVIPEPSVWTALATVAALTPARRRGRPTTGSLPRR